MEQSNEQLENSGISIKESSHKLDISESTVRKYIKDFELGVIKGSGSRALITQIMYQALSEIVKLRANGLSIQEIKELKSQEPSKHILDELDETQTQKVESSTAEMPVANSENNNTEQPPIEENVSDVNVDSPELSLEVEEDVTLEQADDVEEAESEEVEEPGEEPRRRRGFNYRYVERQVSSDSKRVTSLRQRLRNPYLTVQDRLFFEEALERRILFLNGWKHILRWISKQ